MKRKGSPMKRKDARRAFTLIELLIVIAIIAILAAILFPVFSTVRESTRQGSTMSNMHAIYVGARTFYEDEGRYPTSLFGYAEVALQSPPYNPTLPTARPAVTSDSAAAITPMDQATGNYSTNYVTTGRSLNKGYLFREQVKDYNTFVNQETPVARLTGAAGNGKIVAVTAVYPISIPNLDDGTSIAGTNVTWENSTPAAPGTCGVYGDTDLPANAGYVGQPKVFYAMDSMDIGPKIALNAGGNPYVVQDSTGKTVYELHYSPDWTHERYDPTNLCDSLNHAPLPNQLKYKNPPTERTVLTYNTDHVAYGFSRNVLVLLANGTARTVDVKKALFDPNNALPFLYR